MGTDVSVTVNLDLKTCECGLVYAVPNWVPVYGYECPCCAGRIKQELREKIDKQVLAIDHLNRVISGLRGAMRRRKGVKR